MDRLIAPNSVIQAQSDTAPVTGTPQFATDGNPATSTPATQWPAYQYNAIQEELIAVILGAGLTTDRTNNAQLLAALKQIGKKTIVLADTGAANAYTAVNGTPLVAGTWVDGIVQAIKIAHANTGASTYAPDGLTAIPIYGLGLQPLQGGELALNGTAILMHATIAAVNSGNPICVLMECAGGAQQVAPAAASQHALQQQQKGLRVFSSTGTFVPAVTGTFYFTGVAGGGGGGGGGSNNTSGAAGVCGGGGAYGQWVMRQAFTLTAGVSYTVAIGVGGAAAAGAGQGASPAASGGTGTATTFSGTGITTLTLNPGGGGVGGTQGVTSGNSPGAQGGAGFPNGETSPDALTASATAGYPAVGGCGANGPFGGGGAGGRAGQGAGVAGQSAFGFGSGGAGGGSAYGSGGPGGASTAGMPGFAMIEW